MSSQKICFLIDDDRDDQEIFIGALKETEKPVECHIANDGIEALERLTADSNFVPHYIFLDYQMPRMNGKECLKEIKQLHHLQHVPVFIYTAVEEKCIVEDLKQLGMTAFLPKTCSFGSLVQTLSEVFTTRD